MKKLTRYSLKQFTLYTLAGLFLFTFILLMDRLFQLAELVINKGVGAGAVVVLLTYSMPIIVSLAMPMAAVAGAIMAFGRMASDGEITAIRTSGSTLAPVAAPVIAAAVIIGILMVPFNYSLAPAAQARFRQIFINLAAQDPTLQLEENILIDIPPYTFLCYEIDRDNRKLGEVLIFREQEGDEPALSITARSGIWETGADGTLTLKLFDGTIKHQDPRDHRKFSSIIFEQHSLKLQSPVELQDADRSIEAMTGAEIREKIRGMKERGEPVYQLKTRYHLRSALAGAVPILLITGIPFGIRAEKKGKTIGIGISIFVIAAYYFLTVTGLKLALDGYIPPLPGAWLANTITAAFGSVMIIKSYYR